MRFRSKRLSSLMPLWVGCAASCLVLLLHVATDHISAFTLLKHLEWITYDWRVKQAAKSLPQNATNLGFVFIRDETITALLQDDLDYKAALYWPRHVYGRLTRELSLQGAKAVGFDVLFPDARPDPPTHDTNEDPDAFFARAIHEAGNVILAARKGARPLIQFETNAWAIGDISAIPESDGILRRAKACQDYYNWHPLIQGAASRLGFDLRRAEFASEHISFPVSNHEDVVIRLENGMFDQSALYRDLTGKDPPSGVSQWANPATFERVWELGIVLAAKSLNLDLDNALLQRNRIVLQGEDGIQRVIPVDNENRFYIDWSLKPTDPILTKEALEFLLHQEYQRRAEGTEFTNRWKDKIVVVGSIASGNDLTDLGATALERETYLTSRYWNVANSVIMNRFTREPSSGTAWGLSAGMCLLVALSTWRLRALGATLLATGIGVAYVTLSLWWFIHDRTWLPLIFPLAGLSLTHLGALSYKTVFEQQERRRIKAVFARIVSPNVVNELLSSDELALGGAHRNVTVFFADIRGFTQLTDETQARAEEYVKTHQLEEAAALAYFNSQAQEVLSTVNLYLSLVADIIKKNEGTLDKYIGDCVMAFWGAPNPNPRHASYAVRSAIEAQQAIRELNRQREIQNEQIAQENAKRTSIGLPTLAQLHRLSLGTGINTGTVTVGLMGSHTHILNFTVFGRDINLASRLEALSARGRILIGKNTFEHLHRDDPEIASLCAKLEPTTVKGFREPVTPYEVLWDPAATFLSPKAFAIQQTAAEKA